jgi:hypothetical protein
MITYLYQRNLTSNDSLYLIGTTLVLNPYENFKMNHIPPHSKIEAVFN